MTGQSSTALLCGLAWLLFSTGCTPVDRWPPFTREPAAISPAALPSLAPGLMEPPSAEQPPFVPVDLTALSVEQAVLLALRNNTDLQVRRFGPVINGSFVQIERGRYDPELFAEFEYYKEKATETSRSSGELYNVVGDDTSLSAGLRQELPSGTIVEGTVSHVRTISNREPEQQAARLELSITQSLLRGLGPAVNLASIRQAELETRISLDELRGFSETLLADTEIAYWNYVLAREEIAIFEASLAVARQQREDIESRIEVGTLPRIEVAAAKAEEALRIQALLDARSLLEERRLRLLRLVAPTLEDEQNQPIKTTSNPRISAQPLTDLDDRMALAQRLRADLNEARLRLQQNRLETLVTRNGLLPRLDFFIALGKTGYAENFSAAFRDLDGNTYDLTSGLQLSYLLGNRAAKARDLAAQSSRQQALAAVTNLSQLVQLDVRLAANEVERTRQQIAASRTTRIFQEQTLAAERERFDVGISTALLVAQAQRDLLQTQIAEIEAVVSYRIALVNLYLAEGSLLERRGVVVSD